MPSLPSRRSSVSLAFFILSLAACSDEPLSPQLDVSLAAASAGGAIVDNGVERYPYGGIVGVACARDGAGDVLEISGEIVFRWHSAMTPAGNWTGGDMAVAHHGTAVSLIVGMVYRAPLTNHVTYNSVAEREVGSNTMRYRYVGPGPENNVIVEATAVWNFTREGLAVTFSNYSYTCGTDGANVPGSNEPASPIHEWPPA